MPEYLERATISFAGSALRNDYANSDGEYELVPVQVFEPVTTQESPEGRADSHGPSTLRSSTEGSEGRESNAMLPEEPVRWPQGNGSDARSHSPGNEEGEIESPPRVSQAPQNHSRT